MKILLLTSSFFGLNLTEILLHVLNLFILLLGINLLLYKPIKKIIDNRNQKHQEAIIEHDKLVKDTEDLKQEYATLKKDTEKEIDTMRKDAIKDAEQVRNNIINNAVQESSKIIEKANESAKQESKKLKEELSKSVPDLAINIASKVIKRELKNSDNDEIISSIIDEWKN